MVVEELFVEYNQYTNIITNMIVYGNKTMVDKTVRRVPLAKIEIDTPFFTGEVTALCLLDAIYNLFTGNKYI